MDLLWNFSHTYAELPELLWSGVRPTPVAAPRLVIFNSWLAQELGLVGATAADDCALARLFSGNELPAQALPLAQAYAGHQFGGFTRLGDGRAILLGEQNTPAGTRYDVQLKGAGRTPYSRGGDGRATLAPMLREYVISEALHGLGIPTTRSLAVVATGEEVLRQAPLPGAVLTRVARSHVRVGTFEFAAQFEGGELVARLVEHCVDRLYPELRDGCEPHELPLRLLEGVIARQARLVAQWQSVGFVHGVMNTDNMAISGESIDFGPCAFIDYYDPATCFSSIDRHGRYAFCNQPRIALWNLARFAEALLPLFSADEPQAIALAEGALGRFEQLHQRALQERMGAKLGLLDPREGDTELVRGILSLMHRRGLDYTTTFRQLCRAQGDHDPHDGGYHDAEYTEWLQAWRERTAEYPAEQLRACLERSNPAVIPRNHVVEQALSAAERDSTLEPLQQLLGALKTPFDSPPPNHPLTIPPLPEQAKSYKTFCGT
jgi:uncharacterized protein YdiU (UPF0061 family)